MGSAAAERKWHCATWLAWLSLWPGAAMAAQVGPPVADGESVAIGEDPEIVVTARYGEALVEPETELDERQIDAYGAYSIGELVRRIAPLTGRPGEPPIVLINGERVDSIRDLASFPPAALQRLAILPPQAAGRYGYPGNQRVVNLVLKRHFVSWDAQAAVKMPTAGGRIGGNASAGRFVIDGKARWNAQVQLAGESALFKSSRAPAAVTPGGSRDPGDALSLLPATRQQSITLGLTRPIGRFTGSVSANAAASGSRQWLGAAGSGADAASWRVLRGRQTSQNLNLSATLSGPLAGGRASFGANYARGWTTGRIDQPDAAAVAGFRTSRSRSASESMGARATFNRPLARLPAGPLTATLTAGANRSRTVDRFGDAQTGERIGRTARDRFDGRLSAAVPLARRSANPGSLLGDLSLDLAGGLSFGSREASRSRYELGMNWTPVPALRLDGSVEVAKLTPSLEQLAAPYVEEVRRVYDFARQEIADPIWVTGGNPELGSGRRRTWSFGATLRPLGPRLLSLALEYRKQESTGGAGGFPGLTPAIEAAFPDRFVRDAAGRLIRVDARPIRIVRDTSERLNNSLTLSLAPGARKSGNAGGARMPGARWTLSFTLNHRWNLRSELVTARDLPPIDRLRGGTAQSRHQVGFQLVAGRPGMGATLGGNWESGFTLRAPDTAYRYRPTMTANLRLFAEPERLLPATAAPDWLSGLNITLDIRNLLGSYRRVTLANGGAVPGYARYEVDPLGRTVQFSLRKRF